MNSNFLFDIYNSLGLFVSQTAIFIIRLVFAYLIWLIGKYIIQSVVKLVQKADIKSWSIDDSVRKTLIKIGVPTAKIVLILIILDYLGIGTSIIGALAQGITYTIAITLGIAFGNALIPEATRIVKDVIKKTDIRE